MKTTFKQTLVENTNQTKFLESVEEITAWLNTHKIKDFEIHDDLTVTVKNDFTIPQETKATEIPVKFRDIFGVIDVSGNKLTSIDWAPKIIRESFHCWDNELETLEGGPTEAVGAYDVDGNRLTSLKGAPQKVGKAFICSQNPLTSLVGCPSYVGTYFKAIGCTLNKVDALPEFVGTNIYLQTNQIKSFTGINKLIKSLGSVSTANSTGGGAGSGFVNISKNPTESGLLSLASIKGLNKITFSSAGVTGSEGKLREAIDIINEGLSAGHDVLEIHELLENDELEDFA